MQKKITKETKKDRKWASNTYTVRKHMIRFNNRQDKYEALVSKAKDKEKYSAAEDKIWCSIQKKKEDGVILSKVQEVRTYTRMVKDWELLTIK